MNKSDLLRFIADAVKASPKVEPLLSKEARAVLSAHKSETFLDAQLRRLVVYAYSQALDADNTMRNLIVAEIIAAMMRQISEQLNDAYQQAWKDEDEPGAFPTYLQNAWQSDVNEQNKFISEFIAAVVVAAAAGLPIEPFLARIALWSNRWNESYNKAIALIAQNSGGNLVWLYGETEHCETCLSLNGIVASFNDWEYAGVKPQNAPNNLLECGGWNCQCRLQRTDQPQTPGGLSQILSIIGR